jgi:glycosyltransferase involved in cell wall biosynthesis
MNDKDLNNGLGLFIANLRDSFMKSSTKTKILIFSPALNAVSGVSTHVNLLINSTLSSQFEFIHFQVGSEGRSENKLQRLARFVYSPVQLGAMLIRHRPSIVHINTSMDLKAFWRDLSYFIVARMLGRKIVNQFHSGSAPSTLFSNPVLSCLLRRFLLASHVVTVLSSEALRSHKTFDERIAVSLVPNAIDTTGLLEVELKSASAVDPLKLVYVGRIVRSKGLLDALEALKLLKDSGLRFGLKVAGSGPDEAAVRTLIASLNLEAQVTLLGPVFGDAKNKLWCDSDVQVFPTYHNEGLPYSILESMAAGCVPVTCSVAAIPDVMQDGVHGLFVPARDPEALAVAIRNLDSDRAALARMSFACRERIREHYTVNRLADRFGEIYTRLSN